MLTLRAQSKTAIIVLHEIYGINQHIRGVCNEFHTQGYDVYCPNLIATSIPFSYEQHEEAYSYFMHHVSFLVHTKIDTLLEKLRPHYEKCIIIGFSIGATIAWLCSKNPLCSGVVGYYGSRIRDYVNIQPQCPVLLLFAQHEAAFSALHTVWETAPPNNIIAKRIEAPHGFCDPFSLHYTQAAASAAQLLTQEFIQRCTKPTVDCP